MKPWQRALHNFGIWIDQTVNTWSGGDPDETISSRLGKYLEHPTKCRLCQWTVGAVCAFLDLFQKGHCLKSIDPDEGKDAIFKTKDQP